MQIQKHQNSPNFKALSICSTAPDAGEGLLRLAQLTRVMKTANIRPNAPTRVLRDSIEISTETGSTHERALQTAIQRLIADNPLLSGLTVNKNKLH